MVYEHYGDEEMMYGDEEHHYIDGEEEMYAEEEHMVDPSDQAGDEEQGSQMNQDASVENPSPTKTEIDKQEILRKAQEIEMTNRFIHSTLLEILNEARQKHNLPAFYENLSLGNAAVEYAEWFARDRNDEVTPNPGMVEAKVKSAGYEGK